MEKIVDERVYKDKKLSLQYQILHKIGSGAFGSVYKCVNLSSQETVAIKVEFINKNKYKNQETVLMREYTILKMLDGITGIPKVYSIKSWTHGYLIEMQLMSTDYSFQLTKKMTFREIRTLAVELLLLLKKVHSRGIVHQDIKPQNIMRTAQGNIALIDFGLSRKQIDIFKDKRRKLGFVGTPRYASLAAHQGIPQTGKDDIESFLYVLGYLYTKRSPWSNLVRSSKDRLETIYQYKKMKNRQWFQECGKPFSSCYNYLQELSDNSEIDYGYLIKLFQYHRESLTTNFKHTTDRKMSTFINSPYIINIQEIKKSLEQQAQTQIKEELESNKKQGQTLLNFSSQVIYMELADNAIYKLTENIFKSSGIEVSEHNDCFDEKLSETDDEPVPQKIKKFELSAFLDNL